jgi:hypothetical protein
MVIEIPAFKSEIDPKLFEAGVEIFESEEEVLIDKNDPSTAVVARDPYEAARLTLIKEGCTPKQISDDSRLQGLQTLIARHICEQLPKEWHDIMNERVTKYPKPPK